MLTDSADGQQKCIVALLSVSKTAKVHCCPAERQQKCIVALRASAKGIVTARVSSSAMVQSLPSKLACGIRAVYCSLHVQRIV